MSHLASSFGNAAKSVKWEGNVLTVESTPNRAIMGEQLYVVYQ